MIESFVHKGLAELFKNSRTRRIDARVHERILRRLDALDEAGSIQDLNVPAFDFHALHGHNPTRYSIHVNGPWCITFEFDDGQARRVDLEQYH